VFYQVQCLQTYQDLFNRIGPVAKLHLVYDKTDRSQGIAFVTYEAAQDAKRAIREFDGANANGKIRGVIRFTCFWR
jgi:RNA recognition motif-containing protein